MRSEREAARLTRAPAIPAVPPVIYRRRHGRETMRAEPGTRSMAKSVWDRGMTPECAYRERGVRPHRLRDRTFFVHGAELGYKVLDALDHPRIYTISAGQEIISQVDLFGGARRESAATLNNSHAGIYALA
jgi:hypothetical protein